MSSPTDNSSKRPSGSPHLVVAVAYDDLCLFEFGAVVEIFGLPRPEMGSNWYRFAVAAGEPGQLRALGGVRIVSDGGLELLERADTIIVTGWRNVLEDPPAALVKAIRAAHLRGARLVSMCSGAFVLAAAGVLSGRSATTHWLYTDQLRQRHPDIHVKPDVIYIDDEDVLTSAAGVDVCLHIVRRDFGPIAANMIARNLVVPPHREGGQSQYVERAVAPAREGARLASLFDRMRKRLHEPQSVAKLAAAAGMSRRTFLRRFKAATGSTPAAWLLAERLAEARSLLETTCRSVDDVATACGLGTADSLRHHFRRRFGISPVRYRASFTTQSSTR
ncbi:MAG: transcriptional regulator FtrA [Gammaproteobacteria bacterium]|nr:transcriptional regulator FtrA [Gammaproteobacteria bacterium]